MNIEGGFFVVVFFKKTKTVASCKQLCILMVKIQKMNGYLVGIMRTDAGWKM